MELKAPEYKVPWSGVGHKYTQEEIDVVVESMKNADPLTQGRYQTEFENKFKKTYGLNSAFAVTSCAAALELSAIMSKIRSGDEVIVPGHTFAVSAIPFARRGAKIVWGDLNPDTFLMTAKNIEPLITQKTKALVIVHLYGQACEMCPIVDLAKKHNLLIVEDVAQSMGAKHNNQWVGSFGDFSCYSFHTHKNMTTLGEGGMLCVKDQELAKVAPGFRHNGMRAYPEGRECYWQPAMGNVDFDWDNDWPFNFCMGEVQAALGAKLLDRVPIMNEERRLRAEEFKREMSEFPELEFQQLAQGSTHVYHLLPARYNNKGIKANRDDLMKMLAFEHKVKAVVQYHPLYRYPMFQKAGFGQANCPETDRFFDNMVSFPFHHWMPRDQFDYMMDVTKKTLKYLRQK